MNQALLFEWLQLLVQLIGSTLLDLPGLHRLRNLLLSCFLRRNCSWTTCSAIPASCPSETGRATFPFRRVHMRKKWRGGSLTFVQARPPTNGQLITRINILLLSHRQTLQARQNQPSHHPGGRLNLWPCLARLPTLDHCLVTALFRSSLNCESFINRYPRIRAPCDVLSGQFPATRPRDQEEKSPSFVIVSARPRSCPRDR